MKIILAIVLSLHVWVAAGQTQSSIEQDLLKQFKLIGSWRDYKEDGTSVSRYDSLDKANKSFQKSLLRYTAQYPSTLQADFKTLVKEGLTIATSPDGLFRIYSWDTWNGGTMHFFENVYQYQSGSKVFSKLITESTDPGEPNYFYSDIYSLVNGKSTWYLTVRHGIYSSKDCYQGVKVFSLTGTSLDNNAKLIKTRTGIRNTLGFEFDFFSVVDRPERPVKLITYDTAAKKITIPVVTVEGKVTDKFIEYQFAGQYFKLNK